VLALRQFGAIARLSAAATAFGHVGSGLKPVSDRWHCMTLPASRERLALGKILGGRAVQPAAPVDAWLGRG
jgi:hypothetical protein